MASPISTVWSFPCAVNRQPLAGGVVAVEEAGRDRGQTRLEVAHEIPDLNAGISLQAPVDPGEIFLAKLGGGRIHRMGEEGQSSQACDLIEESRGPGSKPGELPLGPKHEQVVLLRHTHMIVDFFPNQEEHALIAMVAVALHTLDPDVVVGDYDEIQAGAQSRITDLVMRPHSVGEGCMHVKIASVFVDQAGLDRREAWLRSWRGWARPFAGARRRRGPAPSSPFSADPPSPAAGFPGGGG